MEPQDTFWWRLVHLDPAVYKGVIVAVVGLLASFGVMVTPGIPDQLVLVIAAVLALAQAVWVRKDVTPNAKVVSYLPDPFRPAALISGEAATTASDSKILSASKSVGDAQ